jgi:hypothetical protein
MIFKRDRIGGVSTYCFALGFNMRVRKVSQPEVAVDAETLVYWPYNKIPFIARPCSNKLVWGKLGFARRWAVFDMRYYQIV